MKILGYIFIFIFVSCTTNRVVKKLNIVEFFAYTNTDTTKVRPNIYEYKVRRFYVENFKGYDDFFYQKFAKEKIEEIDSVFRVIHIYIYKKSRITNIDHLRENPKDVDRYSQNNDMLYVFTSSNVRHNLNPISISMTKYRKGEIID